jgi:hypothetical protein
MLGKKKSGEPSPRGDEAKPPFFALIELPTSPFHLRRAHFAKEEGRGRRKKEEGEERRKKKEERRKGTEVCRGRVRMRRYIDISAYSMYTPRL